MTCIGTITGFIEGAPVKPHDGYAIEVINPATEARVGTLLESDAGEVALAIAAARRAFDTGPWPRMSADERKAILYAIAARIRSAVPELAQLEVLNTGLPISSIEWQIERAAANFEVFADVAGLVAGQTFSQNKGYLTYVTREPKGVAGLISPWNAPLALSSMRLATCIAYGNTCVLKPSEYTPHSIYRMIELIHEAGLPAGVVNLVNGRGHVTGTALVESAEIDMVGFTGGTETGRAIMAAAGRNLKPCLLELGGKSASIVFDSADFDVALDGTLAGIFSNNGQQCLAGSRILVQNAIADRFIAAFTARARAIRVGDPLDPATELGPLAYRAHSERVLAFAKDAREDGAVVHTGGTRPAHLEKGWFVEPIVVEARRDARVCQEEIFGPFATIIRFETIEEAIAIANDSEFGLVSYAWTRDLDTAMRCSREIRVGTVWVNTTMMRELRAPFGGMKNSGIGRDGAESSTEFFTELKTTSIPLAPVQIPRFGVSLAS